MSRIPPKPRDQLSGEQQECYDLFERVAKRSWGPSGDKFIYENEEGGYIGPFPFYTAAPKVGMALYDLIVAIAQLPIPSDARETAIMTVGAFTEAAYETYSHLNQAIEAGLSREQAETLKKDGSKPEGLNEGCSVSYDVARHLVTRKGALPQELWDRAIKSLGKDGTVALLHYIGLYSYVAVALNGIDAGAPE